MANLRFWFSVGYKLAAGIIAGLTAWAQFDALGLNAWRLLETWLLLIATAYFLVSVVAEWLRRNQPMPHKAFCPLLQGFIIVAGFGLLALYYFYQSNQALWLGATAPLVYIELLVVPLLALGDWLFFTKKGAWSASYPFYWLGIIISFACVLILTVDFVPDANWAYPYSFLDYPKTGIDMLLWWLLFISVVILVIGYTTMVIDYTISGKLGQHIVMPRIKTIVIEEPIVEEAEVVTSEEIAKIKQATKTTAKSASKNKPTPSAKSKDDNSKPAPATEQPKPERPTVNDIKPVEGLKDQKSAQKLHRTSKNSKSKSEIIADMRLKVNGNKSTRNIKPRSSKKV